MVKVPEWKLEAFEWLSLDRWTPDHLLTDYSVSGKRYCKVCDEWVSREEEKRHVKQHVKQWLDVKKKRSEEAKRKREEGKRIAAAERKRLRDLQKSD